jgi:hypothetical protein
MLDERLIQLLRHNTALMVGLLRFYWEIGRSFSPSFRSAGRISRPHRRRQNLPLRKTQVLRHGDRGPIDLPLITKTFVFISTICFLKDCWSLCPQEFRNLSRTWVGIGIRTDPSENRSYRLTKLIEALQASIPAEDARYGEWLHFGRGWAELVLLSNERNDRISETARQGIKNLQSQVDSAFTTWISKRYVGLVNLPPAPPVMLHHVPRFLAREVLEDRKKKIALPWSTDSLTSGLSCEKRSPRDRQISIPGTYGHCLIPTITSVSRQAVLRKAAHFLSQQYSHYRKEPGLWAQFWVDQASHLPRSLCKDLVTESSTAFSRSCPIRE